jgi:hypothetical protein
MRKIIAVAGFLAVAASPAWAGNQVCEVSCSTPPVQVPEPSSLALIASGVAALGTVAVRRARREKQ